jgi:hypothetical protein
MERLDFVATGFASTTTLEERKTTAYINQTVGTNGAHIPGPNDLRLSPFSWYCLTSHSIAARKVLGISICWADGMGFASNATPPKVVQQHAGCDNDIGFYNSMAGCLA